MFRDPGSPFFSPPPLLPLRLLPLRLLSLEEFDRGGSSARSKLGFSSASDHPVSGDLRDADGPSDEVFVIFPQTFFLRASLLRMDGAQKSSLCCIYEISKIPERRLFSSLSWFVTFLGVGLALGS